MSNERRTQKDIKQTSYYIEIERDKNREKRKKGVQVYYLEDKASKHCQRH